MAKKKGDNSIKSDERLRWLKRYEDGESEFKIAVDAQVDYRTVLKHIGIARNERELKDERSHVLRNHLERHFADLINIVGIMIMLIDESQSVEFSGDNEFLNDCLREHIPRSKVWTLLHRWNSKISKLTPLETTVRKKLEDRLSMDKDLTAISERKGGELIKRIRSALRYNPKERGRGQPDISVKPSEREIRIQLLQLVKKAVSAFIDLDDKELSVFMDTLSIIEGEMEAWEEFAKIGELYGKLAETREDLKKVLRILKWKGVVPGRCQICPM